MHSGCMKDRAECQLPDQVPGQAARPGARPGARRGQRAGHELQGPSLASHLHTCSNEQAVAGMERGGFVGDGGDGGEESCY